MRYQPSDPDGFRLLVEALPVDLKDYVFVDLGLGKGRVFLLASEYPFRRVVGVEFAQELNEIAERNVALYDGARRRCGEVRMDTADAADYLLPEEPVVLYLYNPFAPEVLRRHRERNRDSLERGSRPAYVLVTGASRSWGSWRRLGSSASGAEARAKGGASSPPPMPRAHALDRRTSEPDVPDGRRNTRCAERPAACSINSAPRSTEPLRRPCSRPRGSR